MSNSGYTHLSLKNRNLIELYLSNNSSLNNIAEQLAKNPTTISKEIKRNRYLFVRANAKNKCGLQNDCSISRLCDLCSAGLCKHCSHLKCSQFCDLFQDHPNCKRTNRFPFVCNACDNLSDCSLPKFFYKADIAHNNYLNNLSTAKSGPRITDLDLAKLDEVISLGVSNNHSIDVIIKTSNFDIAPSTVYRYIDDNLLSIKNIDLKRKVSYKRRYSKKTTSKPINYNYLQGRTFEFFLAFMQDNVAANIWQLDTIEGQKGFDQHAVLSLLHMKSNLQLYFKLKSICCSEVVSVLDSIKNHLGTDLFKDTFTAILTDNGKEFRDPLSMESCPLTGEKLTQIFYCEPRRSDQKAKCEKNHVHFRECVPKSRSMNDITDSILFHISNNVNNYPRKSLAYNSPFQVANNILNKKVFELNRLSFVTPKDVKLKHLK